MNLIVLVLDSFRQDHVSNYNQGHGPFPVFSQRLPDLHERISGGPPYDS